MEQRQLKPCGSAYLGLHQFTPPNKYRLFETGRRLKARHAIMKRGLARKINRLMLYIIKPDRWAGHNRWRLLSWYTPGKWRLSHGASQFTFTMFHFVRLAEFSMTVKCHYRSFAQKPTIAPTVRNDTRDTLKSDMKVETASAWKKYPRETA